MLEPLGCAGHLRLGGGVLGLSAASPHDVAPLGVRIIPFFSFLIVHISVIFIFLYHILNNIFSIFISILSFILILLILFLYESVIYLKDL